MFRRVNPSVVIIRARWKEVSGRVSEVGSGFLVSADGKIITAAHVVQTADEITAEFLGGETIPAKVVASEPGAGVALLELERPPTQPILARMGDSDTVQVGVASHNISRSGGFEGLGFVVPSIRPSESSWREVVLERDGRARGPGQPRQGAQCAAALRDPRPAGGGKLTVRPDRAEAQHHPRHDRRQGAARGRRHSPLGPGHGIGDSSYEEIQERLSALPAGSLVRLVVLRDGQRVELSAPR